MPEETQNTEASPQPEPTPSTSPISPKEPVIEEMTTLHERTIALLSYASFFAIVPFYLKKDSKFCRFHGKQGMVLALAFFISSVLSIADVLFDLFLILQVSIFFFMGFAAISGRWKKLPFIYDWACKFEEALSLKSKEEEEEESRMKPDEVNESAK